MKLVVAMGNGHNFIVPTSAEKGSFNQFPLQFYKFSSGLFIVAADTQYQQLVGSKVIAFVDTRVAEALSKTQIINARDNEIQQLWLGPHYLGLHSVLKGLNIVNDAENISITIEDTEDGQRVVKPKLKAMQFNGFLSCQH